MPQIKAHIIKFYEIFNTITEEDNEKVKIPVKKYRVLQLS